MLMIPLYILDFSQQLEVIFQLDLRDKVDWSKTWLLDFSAGKSQLN